MQLLRRFSRVVVTLAICASGLAPDVACAQTADARVEEARAEFTRAEDDFAAERYSDASRRFLRAYELLRAAGRPTAPLVLYNYGLSLERSGRDREALAAYERFVNEAVAPDEDTRNKVLEARGRIGVLRSALEGPDDSSDRSRPRAASDGASAGPGGWILLGAGALVAVAGGVMLGVGLDDVSRVDGAPMGTPWSELEDAHERSAPLTGAGITALAVGGAMMAGGLAWALVDGGGSGERAALEVRWTGSSVSVRGRF